MDKLLGTMNIFFFRDENRNFSFFLPDYFIFKECSSPCIKDPPVCYGLQVYTRL